MTRLGRGFSAALMIAAACTSSSPSTGPQDQTPSSSTATSSSANCQKISLSSDLTPGWLRLTQAQESGDTARFVYEDEQGIRSLGVLTGIRGEMPELTETLRAEGHPVGRDLMGVVVQSGLVAFILVWDEAGNVCQPAVVIASGLTDIEIGQIESALIAEIGAPFG